MSRPQEPGLEPRAVIFDVDGVLADSFRPHYESWRQMAAEHGVVLAEDFFLERCFGRINRDTLKLIFGPDLEPASIEQRAARKEELYQQRIRREFRPIDGAIELIDALRGAGFRIGVGSSGPPPNVELVLERLGRSLFEAVVTRDDVRRGKPDPEVFLRGAERLGVRPERCVVIEDAAMGIAAANAGGMRSVALVSTGHRREDYRDVEPDLVVDSLRELSPETLAGLLPHGGRLKNGDSQR